jgi:NADH-ubiquinone oxidoreductase chain 5
MSLLLLYFPLIGACLSGFGGKFIGHKGTVLVTIGCMLLTFLTFLIVFYETSLSNSICFFKIGGWIDCEYLNLEWGILIDNLTSVMMLLVITVSLLVHIFSLNYMKNDPHFSRFMSYLSLFTFFMLILITADNFAQMFLGWEGVGLASYLLINFWFTRYQANKSALKAIILNRIGDFGLVLAIAGIFSIFKSLDYSIVFSTAYLFSDFDFFLGSYKVNSITLIGLLLFLGAVGKSAQLGLHTWLPDAMEGPTPVSALIHAATMVTAGIFLIIRCSPLLEYTHLTLIVITIIGATTAFFAATSGILQHDIKRVIAYSTCSQLGYMVFACGLSNYSTGLFHLINHGFFKALLFLSAGAVIHALSDEQDMRRMGGLYKILPFVYTMFLIGSLSLMGFPFLTGFYSKDVILEIAISTYTIHGIFAYWLGTLSAFFTAFYSFRLIFLTFLSKPRGYKTHFQEIHEIDIYMGIPLSILAFGSIFIGFLLKDLIIGLGVNTWQNTIFFLPQRILLLEIEYVPIYLKLLPVILSLSGALFSLGLFFFYHKIIYNLKLTKAGNIIYKFFIKKWYFDLIYFFFIVKPVLDWGYNITFKLIDRGLIELFGPLGLTRLFNNLSNISIKNQTGYIFNYAFMIFFGTLVCILILQGLLILKAKLIIIFILLLINDIFLLNKNNDRIAK